MGVTSDQPSVLNFCHRLIWYMSGKHFGDSGYSLKGQTLKAMMILKWYVVIGVEGILRCSTKNVY